MKLLATALLLVALSPTMGHAASPTPNRLPRPYLALFNFGPVRLQDLTDRQLRLLNASPYDGMATWWPREYSVKPPPPLRKMLPRLKHLREMTHKDLWPFAFLNRIVEMVAGHNHNTNAGVDLTKTRFFKPVYTKIHGMDLDNATGSLSVFLLTWRRNLEIAKFLHSPGVGFDPEVYNDYQYNNLAALAQRRGETPAQTRRKLRIIGARMANIVGQVYPHAVIWCTFTGFADAHYARLGVRPGGIAHTPGYILEGLLDRANQAHIPLRLIDGSETGIGYLFQSLGDLKAKIRAQELRNAAWVQRYPQLVLGGTISPWLDTRHMAFWMKDKVKPTVANIEQFKPFFTTLMERCRFVWIYAANNAYNPWDKPYTKRFPPVLAAAKAQASRHPVAPLTRSARYRPPIGGVPIHVIASLGTTIGDFGRTAVQRGPHGELLAKLTPEAHRIGASRFVAVLGFPVWPGGSAPPWPTLYVPLGQHTDWRNYRGLAVEVYNPGARPAELGVDIHDRKDGEWYCYYSVAPHHGGVIYIPTQELQASLDIATVRTLALLMRRPPHLTHFYLSPVILVK